MLFNKNNYFIFVYLFKTIIIHSKFIIILILIIIIIIIIIIYFIKHFTSC